LSRAMRIVVILISWSCAVLAQSVAVTSPAGGANIRGWTYNLTCSVSSITNLAWVEYFVDGETAGYVRATEPATCPSLVFNTYTVGNGAHVFTAAALSLLDIADGTITASSVPVTANVENYLPQQLCAFNASATN